MWVLRNGTESVSTRSLLFRELTMGGKTARLILGIRYLTGFLALRVERYLEYFILFFIFLCVSDLPSPPPLTRAQFSIKRRHEVSILILDLIMNNFHGVNGYFVLHITQSVTECTMKLNSFICNIIHDDSALLPPTCTRTLVYILQP